MAIIKTKFILMPQGALKAFIRQMTNMDLKNPVAFNEAYDGLTQKLINSKLMMEYDWSVEIINQEALFQNE